MLPFLNGHYRGCSVGDLVSDDVQAIILHQKKKRSSRLVGLLLL